MSTEEATTKPAEGGDGKKEGSKKEALRKSAVRHASQLGSSMKQGAKPKDASEYVKFTKAVLDFTIMQLMAERALLDELSQMSDEEKMATLFELMDKNKDGTVDATELADGLRKIRGDVNFEESLVLAIDRIATFDKQGTGKLSLDDFKGMTNTIAEALGTDFHQLSEMLVMAVLFSATGNDEVENLAAAVTSDAATEVVKEEESARKAMVDQRMKALFSLFDMDDSGSVDFKEVVIGMYRMTEDLEGSSKAALAALMLFDDNQSRSLDYDQFAKFIINVVAASPEHITFDDVADAMTLAASQDVEMTAEELLAVLMLEETVQEVLDLKAEADKHMEVSESQLTRCHKLFRLWDLNADGAVDIKEMALALRKFEEAGSMQTTVAEAIELMGTFDLDGDQSLNRDEFIIFLVQFAKLSGSDFDEFLDFMIVVSALKENSDGEVKYIKSLTESDIYYFGA